MSTEIVFNSPSDDSDTSDIKEEAPVTAVQIQRDEMIASSGSAVTTSYSASNSVSSMLALYANTLVLYISTVQMLSLIEHLNINIPYEIKAQQSSTSKFMKKMNILLYIHIQNKEPSDYIKYTLNDDNSFLAQIIYNIILLLFILIFNALIYWISKYAKGICRECFEKL